MSLFKEPWLLAAIILLAIVLFGAAKLPDIARNLGKSAKVMKEELKDLRSDDDEPQQASPPPVVEAQQQPAQQQPVQPPAPQPVQQPVQQPAAQQQPADVPQAPQPNQPNTTA